MTLPAEVLAPSEVELLLGSFRRSPTAVRNCAIVTLMYRAGVKAGQIVALERRHFEPGGGSLVIPPSRHGAERKILIDATTREMLDRWTAVRKRLGVRPTAPLFCTLEVGSRGNRLHTAYLRTMLATKARALGIDKRVSPEGLRRSGKEHRERSHASVEARIGTYLDEESFRLRYPNASEKWQSALDLYALHPARHATRIGHDCREALLLFVNEALAKRHLASQRGAGTVDKLRTLIQELKRSSPKVRNHLQALVVYWGTVSDLAQRQEHGASRDRDELDAEDARRLIFSTMIVMFEVDRATGGSVVQADLPNPPREHAYEPKGRSPGQTPLPAQVPRQPGAAHLPRAD